LPAGLHSDLSVPPPVVTSIPKAEDSYSEAVELYERGCYPDAEEKVSALLAADNDNGRALMLLSRIHANQGQLAEACNLCERAITVDKMNPAYHYLLAAVLLEMGKEDESVTCLNRALYLDQDFALAHFALGNIARRRGRKREAERHFENVLSILRTYPPGTIVPESEGIRAERMIEIILAALPEKS
jgi:chemotaxis protein methyltransferase CheR